MCVLKTLATKSQPIHHTFHFCEQNSVVTSRTMDLSIVVSSYGRFEYIRNLVKACASNFQNIDYEIVAVTSDPVDSEKNIWLSKQPRVKLVAVGDRLPGRKRQKSLYFYENLGLEAAKGDWILINNDDTTVSEDLAPAFLEQRTSAEILVIPTEIDDPALGRRAPIIGRLVAGKNSTPLYLLDFAFFHKSVFEKIGHADEGLDWYGRGLDMAIRVALHAPEIRVKPLQGGHLIHHLANENRTPPHYAVDFGYLDRKWKREFKGYPHLKLEIFEWGKGLRLPKFYLLYIWPILRRVKVRVLGQ